MLDGVREGGWLPLVIDGTHPFLIRAARADSRSFDFRVYIWNCTHGGANRADDEYRIQFTSVPHGHEGTPTLLLGWHDELEVFAAWDISAHDGQSSASPSAQIRERTLEAAAGGAFATQAKENEIVVAFRPFLLVDYAQSTSSLHQTGRAHRDMNLLNDLDSLDDEQIAAVANRPRQMVIRRIARRYRAANFSRKVLEAYGHRCAFCRVQLGLLDAAHIVPVSASGSTDEVTNGVALCKLHHFAYDSNLVAFDRRYRIRVSESRVGELAEAELDGGIRGFRDALAPTLVLPANVRYHPNPAYVQTALRVRGWRP
ncbi:restriction endonuclease [Burkholderia sp. Bp8991]|nr:restriction endonuclease [Burkholderia sp. Bp8991]